MLTYADGTQAKVGDIVTCDGSLTRYIVVGFDEYSAKILMIGTVMNEDSPLFGKSIISPTGLTRFVSLIGFERLGYAEITTREDSAPSDAVDTE
jgi:hypothetical protein